jgi:hypothetical protein
MKRYLISLASILIAASFTTAGCNNDGGLLGRLSSKDEPKAEQKEATQPNPSEPVAAQKEMTESEKIDALNKRIAETKALRKKYCPAIVNEAMYNHGSLMEMKFMYDYIETKHPELKGMSTNERSTKLKAIFRQMRITYYNSIDKKLGFFCGNIDKLCDGDSKPCHRIDDYLIDRGKSGRGTPRYELFDYYNKIPQYETLYELMEIVVLDWIDDDKDIFQSGKTNLDFLKEKFYININADPNQPVHVDWAQYGYKDNTPTVQEDNNKINLDNWILDPDKLGKAGDTYSKYLLLLVSSVKNQIELEQGKSTGQFFSIKKCLKPCLKSPSTCYQDMDDYYHESIYKLMRASLALSSIAIPLSNGIANADDHLLSFTIGFASAMYLFASQPQTLNNFINTDAITASPVGREIYNSPLDFKSKQRLIGIWMLRQVHYAVEDIYNQMGVAKATGISFNEMIQGYDEFATPAFLDTITYDSKPTYIDWSKYSSKQKTLNIH